MDEATIAMESSRGKITALFEKNIECQWRRLITLSESSVEEQKNQHEISQAIMVLANIRMMAGGPYLDIYEIHGMAYSYFINWVMKYVKQFWVVAT